MNQDIRHMRKWQKRARRRLFYSDEIAKMTMRDWMVMLSVTLVYAVVAFINLGSFDIPQTFYTMQSEDDEIVVEFAAPQHIEMVKYYTALGTGKVSFFYSDDGEGYTLLTEQVQSEEPDENGEMVIVDQTVGIDHHTTSMYEWQFMPVSFTAKYVSIRVDEPGLQMLEMGFCDSEGNIVDVAKAHNLNPDAGRGNPPSKMFDEQQYIPKQTYYMTEMYFDEVYHARTAYEHIHHIHPYEITHPPLGKTILGIGIRAFGMNPFGWRCMGTLFGVLMLPLMYIFAKRLFKKTLFAFIPTFLFAVDFMHFTQTRIATIDSYSVFFIMLMYFFMYLYTEQNYNRQPLGKTLVSLLMCGAAFGLGAATKWLCLYAGIGLTVVFFIKMGQRYMEYRYARLKLEAQDADAIEQSKKEFYQQIVDNYMRKTLITLLCCVVFFIIIPLVIYYFSYAPYMNAADNPYDFGAILRNQEYMYKYHSQLEPDSPHPFSSEWYKWPIIYRPVFFFQGQGYEDGIMSSMSSMGNPAVWWGAIASVITLIVLRIKRGRFGKRTFFLSIAALSQYLPWVLIPRETYIYHYFATVPFLILLMGVLAKYLIERTRHGKKAVFIYLGVCIALFVMFYPIITGVPVSRAYSDTFLRWIPTWPFY